MKSVTLTLLGLAALATVATATRGAPSKANNVDDRYFEIRTYTTHPDKLDDLNARFRNHTNRLFKKHGMDLIGYWTPTDGDKAKNTLVYILAYPNKEARDKSWKGFIADPEWKKAFQESRADGPIVKKVENQFLTPTDYSPIK